jgi:endonuclease/exonuclease/phosphatase family metal-dependent hydrolase
MRYRLLMGFALLLTIAAEAQSNLVVMTYNIRLNTADDSLNAWPYRKDKLASVVLFHDVNILGVQEAQDNQMVDLRSRLPRFKSCGGGRDDGKTGGEYSAIFYDTSRLLKLQDGQFWLSEKPSVPGSKGWDASFPRIVTWAQFKDNRNNKTFFVFNTHFDHMGKVARRESANLLMEKRQAIAGETASIILGDFNAEPTDEPIRLLSDKRNLLAFVNAESISATPHYGPSGTFNGFGPKEVNDNPIDYIFLKGRWVVRKHATLSQTWQGRFASDHFAVLAELRLF